MNPPIIDLTIVDTFVLATILILTLVGFLKGLMQQLFELLISVASMFIGWLYYSYTQQILKGFLVTIVVFIGLTMVKWVIFTLGRNTDPEKRSFSLINRLSGGLFGFTWAVIMMALAIFLLEMLPFNLLPNYNLKNELQKSKSYQILQRLIPLRQIAFLDKISCMSQVSLDQDAKERLFKQAQFKDILNDPNFQELTQDPQTLSQLQSKNIQGLMANPKIINLLNNGQFLEKLLKLDYQKALGKYYDKIGN